MNTETKLFWATLDFLTPSRLTRLRHFFGDLETARQNLRASELRRAGISERSIQALLKKLKNLNFAKAEKNFMEANAALLFFEDPEFPDPLKQISDPPIFLFCKGKVLPQDTLSLAVVGTRYATLQGKNMVQQLVPELVQSGFTIVSGMARGIDAEAHKAALQSAGRTIAVWGTGIDIPYPKENIQLAHEILKHGAIISEFPLGTKADSYNFPRRNRLISGLTLGTLVVEGEEKSGSLITALLALEQGKEVFATPGHPFARFSAGPNRLIQRGEAKLIQDSTDILNEFPFLQKVTQTREYAPENELEKLILTTLNKEPITFDEIVIKSQKPSFEISAALMMMALKGLVRDVGMNEWTRSF